MSEAKNAFQLCRLSKNHRHIDVPHVSLWLGFQIVVAVEFPSGLVAALHVASFGHAACADDTHMTDQANTLLANAVNLWQRKQRT